MEMDSWKARMMTNNELQALHDENIRLECLKLSVDYSTGNAAVELAKKYERFVKTGETE